MKKILKIMLYPMPIAFVISYLNVNSIPQVLPPLPVCGGVSEPNTAPYCGPNNTQNCKKKTCEEEVMGRIEWMSCCRQKQPAQPPGQCIIVWGRWCCKNNQWGENCREELTQQNTCGSQGCD